ncbi:MAG: gliding motility-associated C-terminal domain-containing protein, partial [Bacteroidetes bacterium]|nr:gliding motility-associated C-terminal domain-containing protein [Bacteroidota bacterium]
DSIGFSIVGDGVGLTYQWRKGLTNLSNGGSISGANTANLSIDPISVLDFDATYNVVLTGTCAPDTISSYITLSSGNCGFDLSISKSASNMEPQYDSIVTFTVIARNIGSRTGTDVGVNEILQNGFEFLSYRSTSGTYDEITGVWTIGNMISAATDTLNIQVKILAGGNYENKVNIYANETDDNMANNRASIELRPFDFHIPEGFSPNNDQVNDLYVIRGISRFPNNQISIYNRWGVRVFTDSPYTNSWDGKSQSASNVGGDKLPVGTYFYILDLGDGSPIYKGTIYLNL